MTVWTSQAVLNALHRLTDATDTVLLDGVVRATGLTTRQAAKACAKLVAHGLLARVHDANGRVKPGVYTLTPDGRYALEAGAKLTSGPRGPHGKLRVRSNTLRDRVWRLLRIRRKLSVPEAVALLCDGEMSAQDLTRTTNNVQKYLRSLRRAGYLADLRREPGTSPTSNGAKRYLLVRDAGPHAPVRRENGTVFDPNTGDVHELA